MSKAEKAEKESFNALKAELGEALLTIKESKAATEWETFKLNYNSQLLAAQLQANDATDRANALAIELGESQAREAALQAELNAFRMNGESMTVI